MSRVPGSRADGLRVTAISLKGVSHHSHTQERDTNRRFVPRLTETERERIRHLRKDLGLSTYEVARLTGTSHATVSRIANERPRP